MGRRVGKSDKRRGCSRTMVWEHLVRGLHARIPLCCIAFYVKTYLPRHVSGERGNTSDLRWAQAYRRRVEKLKRSRSPQYFPCLECVRAKTIEKIHFCTHRCRKQLGSNFYGVR